MAQVVVVQPPEPKPAVVQPRAATRDLMLCRDLFGLICYAFH